MSNSDLGIGHWTLLGHWCLAIGDFALLDRDFLAAGVARVIDGVVNLRHGQARFPRRSPYAAGHAGVDELPPLDLEQSAEARVADEGRRVDNHRAADVVEDQRGNRVRAALVAHHAGVPYVLLDVFDQAGS